MPQALTYAPTPPRDRVEVVWQGDEFEITLPPRVTVRGLATMLALLGATTLLWMMALRRALWYGSLVVYRKGEFFAQCLCLLFGAFTAFWALLILRQGRTWTRITLRGEFLIVQTPALRGTRVTRYRIDSVADATVGRVKSKRDHGRYLLLHRHSRELVPAIENLTCRLSDLDIVAAAIREAIARRANSSD